MTGSLSPLCVCTCSPVPLSLLKTNEQINTWLTWVPWGKLMVSVFTYKLHPAGTATFSAADCQFAGIYEKLLSMSGPQLNSVCAVWMLYPLPCDISIRNYGKGQDLRWRNWSGYDKAPFHCTGPTYVQRLARLHHQPCSTVCCCVVLHSSGLKGKWCSPLSTHSYPFHHTVLLEKALSTASGPAVSGSWVIADLLRGHRAPI